MTQDILAGIRVVELAEGIAAPYCGRLLADFGAEVWKIEPPGRGDTTRQHGPFPRHLPHPERSGLFLALNMNKRGLTLAPDTATGRQILTELLQQADVLIHNIAPPRLGALHLTPDSLRQEHPRLLVTAITPYGQSNPYQHYQGADITACALGGLSEGLGGAGRPPLTAPFSQAGYQAGLSAASATVLALLVRERQGIAQHIDIAEAEVIATLQTGVYLNNFVFDQARTMRGNPFGSRTIYPAGFYRCRDGFMWVTAPQWAQWERLLEMIGQPELANEERFHNRRAIAINPPAALEVPIAQWFLEHTREDIFTLCRQHRLPITPVYALEELLTHPQLVDRGFFMAVEQPGNDTLRLPGLPMQLSRTPWRVRYPAPLLGEHNALMYGQTLGYAPESLTALRRAGVI